MTHHAAPPEPPAELYISQLTAMHPEVYGHTMLMPLISGPHELPPVYSAADRQSRTLEVLPPHPDRFRETLRNLGTVDAERFDDYLGGCVQAATSGRHNRLAHKPEGHTWASWIAQTAEPEEVLGVFTQHNRQVGALNNDPAVEALLDRRREWVATQLKHAAGRWLHQDMYSVGEQLQDKVKVWFGDDLQDELLRMGFDAYCAADKTYVLLSQHLDVVDQRERQRLALRGIDSNHLFHELLHAGKVAEWLPEWAIEVGVEDITQSGLHGGDLKRALKPSEDAGYMNHREIRETLLKAGSYAIDDETYMMAVSSMHATNPEAERLVYELDDSWGIKGALSFVTRRLETWEQTLQKAAQTFPEASFAWLRAVAASLVNDELHDHPEKVFGPHYKKPQPPVKTAVGRAKVNA